MDIINNLCRQESLNPLVAVIIQMSFILTLSHFFQLILRPIGQPGPIAHILAGVVSGPSVLSRIEKIQKLFWPPNIEDYYKFFAQVTGVIFMFVIGLEVDIAFARRNFRAASSLAYGGLLACAVLGAIITPFFITECAIGEKRLSCTVTTMTILSTVASPVVIRLAEDFKMDTSDAGRLAITAALINETITVVLYSAFLVIDKASNTWKLLATVLLTAALVTVNSYLANWYNHRWDNQQKYVNRANLVLIMFSVGFAATMVRNMGLSTTIPCFFAGLLFPREGKTARSLLSQLKYFVHVFVLPVYFGYAGAQFTADGFRSLRGTFTVILYVVLNIGGKVVGTLAACHCLKIPKKEGIILAFVLSLKGHFDLEIINIGSNDPQESWTGVFVLHGIFIESIVLTTVIAGTVVAFMVRKGNSVFSNKNTSLEHHDPESELRILACVYSPIHTSGALALISTLNGPLKPPFTPYLMHLVELVRKKTDSKPKLFHELSEVDQLEEEEEYGGFDVLEINGAIDNFTLETKIFIRYEKAVSYTNTLFEDVCNGAEDKQVSIIFVPFHKHQRIDGKMEPDASIIQTTNHKVLRHAPCSVGIFVDKSHTGFQQPHNIQSVQHVAALFFSGPDDREALTCCAWMSRHPHVSLTVIRFLQVSDGNVVDDDDAPPQENEVLMAMTAHEADYANDNTFMVDFYNRYIVTGKVGYLEKHISSAVETVRILREMQEMYSLFIVGRGGRGESCITSSLSDWEECPELGTVGDLLASSEFESSGSVLVVQKHKSYR